MTKTSAAAVTSFIPTLVKTFGYDKVKSLLLVAPPYVFAAICAMSISISSDRRLERCGHLIVPLAFGMVGYIIAAATTTLAPRYFSLFLMLGGIYGGFNVAIAWVSSTVSFFLEHNHNVDHILTVTTASSTHGEASSSISYDKCKFTHPFHRPRTNSDVHR